MIIPLHFGGSTESTGSFGGGGKAATLTDRALSASSAACLYSRSPPSMLIKQ